MSGLYRNTIEDICKSLSDQYLGGFPIIKELIQNADDSEATEVVFGLHGGFGESAPHQLLNGPGLWCLNNGGFKSSDKRAIRSFGENSKAGDSSTIGKFGLGMKSVFHLCESFCYIAHDGNRTHADFLNPWNNNNRDENGQPEWLHADLESDWYDNESDIKRYLENFKSSVHLKNSNKKTWFLLWVPLRRREHSQGVEGKSLGTITSSFPGDDLESGSEMGFLKESTISLKLAKILPLLRNLNSVSFQPSIDNWKAYAFHCSLDALNDAEGQGVVDLQGACEIPKLHYLSRSLQSDDNVFQEIKEHDRWPKSFYRDELGKEKRADDKSSAEGAITFSHHSKTDSRLTLQWSVFLPLEEDNFANTKHIDGGPVDFTINLHGQFFIDAGRRGILGFNQLQKQVVSVEELPELDAQGLRVEWNKRLAQTVVFPLVLPTLADYVTQYRFHDGVINGLTKSLKDKLQNYQEYLCVEFSWFKQLKPAGAEWTRHSHNEGRVLELPSPPISDAGRPWAVLKNLEKMSDTAFADMTSICLKRNSESWKWAPEDIVKILDKPDRSVFAEEGKLDYLGKYLDSVSYALGHGDVQSSLLKYCRKGLLPHSQEQLRSQRHKITHILNKIEGKRRWAIGVVSKSSHKNISDDAIHELWRCDTEVLALPSFLVVNKESPATAKLDKKTAEKWLGKIQDLPVDPALLDATKSILQGLAVTDRLPIIRLKSNWKVTLAYSANHKKDVPVSYLELIEAYREGLLFRFAGKNEHDKIHLLAECLVDSTLLVIRRDDVDLLFDDKSLPIESDNTAILSVIIKSDKTLTENKIPRKQLLQLCSGGSEEKDINGLRYLLHGDAAHKQNTSTLWLNAHQQSSAWEKLWKLLVDRKGHSWEVIDCELANSLSRDSWDVLKLKEIRPESVLEELPGKTADVDATLFSAEERLEILNKVDQMELWCELPLHETLDGELVAVDRDTYLSGGIELPESLSSKIKIIQKQSVVLKQSDWIKKLDEAAAIEIALRQPQSHECCQRILDWLTNATLSEALRQHLCEVRWLTLSTGLPISLDSIISISGLEDVLQRLASAAEYCYVSERDLNEKVLGHDCFESKLKPLFTSEPKELLEKLALLVNEAPEYSIGDLGYSDDLKKLAKVLEDCESAPIWKVLNTLLQSEQFESEDINNYLLRNLDGYPRLEAFPRVFQWLQGRQTQPAKIAYSYYLKQMVSAGYVEELLPIINLLAEDGKSWKKASELCIDAPGVDDAFVLCEQHKKILKQFLKSGDDEQQDREGAEKVSINLEEYVERLRPVMLTRLPLLGLLQALLAGVNSEKVSGYLHPASTDTLFNILSWDSNSLPSKSLIDADRFELKYALTSGFDLRCNLQEAGDSSLLVFSILGDLVTVPLKSKTESLVIKKIRGGARNHPNGEDGDGVGVITAQLELSRDLPSDADQAVAVVKNTCVWLWENIYSQDSHSIYQLWEKLSESHQLDVAVTRSIILKHAAFYLNNLGANREEFLRSVLGKIQVAETRLAEAENNKNATDIGEWRKKTENHQEELIQSLQQDTAIGHVLDKVRSKLKEYQYESDSILFELFQNADDAVLQLERSKELSRDINRDFKVLTENNIVYVLHWGRPINDRCDTEAQEKWPSYGRDLEKMLIISASDKPQDEQVTGRFGLGFKSVFLACDEPTIISADLRVKIIAGFLPEVLQDCGVERRVLRDHSGNTQYPGTLVALPLREGITAHDLLERFRQQQALLCVTSKKIRCVTVDDTEYAWTPQTLGSSSKLEYGPLQGKNYLVFRDTVGHGLAAIVFRVSARGFTLLDESVSSFWVVAPTRETAAVGFIMSAPFQIDAGRGKLAGEGEHNEQNKQLAESLGSKLGYELAQLYKEDWQSLSQRLNLAEDVSEVEFWTSLWSQFDKYNWNKSDAPFHLSTCFTQKLLNKWTLETGLIPNGLSGDHSKLIGYSDVKYCIPKSWVETEAVEILRSWPRFNEKYSSGNTVSDWVLKILSRLDSKTHVVHLGINNLLELIDEKRCSPDTAELLGQFVSNVYSREGALLTTEDKKQFHDSELKFLSEAGTYQSVGRLLISSGEGEGEEQLRAAFAPDEFIVSNQYCDGAISFFKSCRNNMGCSESLEEWFLSAPEQKREAALRYIVKGVLGNNLARSVWKQVNGKWFGGPLIDPLIKGWSKEDKEDLRRLLGLEINRSGDQSTDSKHMTPYSQTTLEQIYDWWVSEGEMTYLNGYFNNLYPNQSVPDLTISGNGDFDRNSWMTMFALASFQQKGRVKDVQNKGFIEFLISNDWWGTFCKKPDESGVQWMDILRQYSLNQNSDELYSSWLDSFPRLYKFAHWMGDYVELFERLDRQNSNDIKFTLTPNIDPSLQGGGWGDTPPLNRTLKFGFNMLVRELLRQEVITNKAAYHFAYMPKERVKNMLSQLTGFDEADLENSTKIYSLLCEELGEKKAHFQMGFDLPLLILSLKPELASEFDIEVDDEV